MGLQGERLQESPITRLGVPGDHAYVVRDRESQRILDPKSLAYPWGTTAALPNMLEIGAEMGGAPDGEHELRLLLADGSVHSSLSEDLNALLTETLGRHVELVKYPRIAESRVTSGRTLHLLTTSSLAHVAQSYPSGDFNLRRFRPNLLAAASDEEGFVEDRWLGKSLAIGSARIRVEKRNVRCVVTTLSQRDLKEDAGILEAIEERNETRLGVMCSVVREGMVRAGDACEVDSADGPE
jgi:uncharacterized protein YcbX